MPGGKHSPALFELLRDKTGTREGVSRAAGPTAAPKSAGPAIVPSPVRVAPVRTPAEVVERGVEGPGAIDFKRPVTVTMFSVWLAVAVVIVVGLVLWTAAYKLGFNKGEGRALKDLGGTLGKGGGTISEPLRNEAIPVNPKLITKAPATPQKPAAAAGGDPASAGVFQRTAGLNYLVIALKMDRETAERAAAFLTERGAPAFAVASSGGSANNPAPYTLYAQQGITREELRARAPVRTELEGKVSRLGKVWQKEFKGRTDFSQTYWERYGS